MECEIALKEFVNVLNSLKVGLCFHGFDLIKLGRYLNMQKMECLLIFWMGLDKMMLGLKDACGDGLCRKLMERTFVLALMGIYLYYLCLCKYKY